MMALFAVLFGARRVDATRHREGLMLAIAFESLFKLFAFVAVAYLPVCNWRPCLAAAGPAGDCDTLFNGDALLIHCCRGGHILPAAPVPGRRGRMRARLGS